MRRVLWLAAYAAATFLAFPQPIPGGVLDLGWCVAWLVPALFFLGLDGLAPGGAARAGFAAGLAAHAAVLHWIYVVTVRYGGAPAWAGVLAPVALAAYIAVFFAAMGAGWAWLSRAGRATAWSSMAVTSPAALRPARRCASSATTSRAARCRVPGKGTTAPASRGACRACAPGAGCR